MMDVLTINCWDVCGVLLIFFCSFFIGFLYCFFFHFSIGLFVKS